MPLPAGHTWMDSSRNGWFKIVVCNIQSEQHGSKMRPEFYTWLSTILCTICFLIIIASINDGIVGISIRSIQNWFIGAAWSRRWFAAKEIMLMDLGKARQNCSINKQRTVRICLDVYCTSHIFSILQRVAVVLPSGTIWHQFNTLSQQQKYPKFAEEILFHCNLVISRVISIHV